MTERSTNSLNTVSTGKCADNRNKVGDTNVDMIANLIRQNEQKRLLMEKETEKLQGCQRR